MEKGLIESRYIEVRSRLNRAIDWILSGRRWKLKALLAVLVLSLFRAFPSYDALGTGFCKAKWRYVQVKCDNPFADMSRVFPAGSHESNLTFRLTVPIVAHALRFRRNGMLFLFGLAGVLLLYTSLDLAHRLTASRKAALFVCAAIACVWPGETAFHELRGGYYDAPALCLLLLAFSARSAPLTALFVFVAAWTDERALIATSFLLVFEAMQKRAGKAGAILAAGAAYAGTRAYLTAMFSYAGGASGVAFSVLSQQTNAIPLAIWTGLGGAWLLVALALLSLVIQKRYLSAAGLCGALAVVAGGAFVVIDTTRSMAYCLPAVFVALSILSSSEPAARVERLTALSSAISLVVPTYYLEGSTGFWWLYPLPVQIGRWLLPGLLSHL